MFLINRTVSAHSPSQVEKRQRMSPELEALKECRNKVIDAIKPSVEHLSWKLLGNDVIIGYMDRTKVAGEKADTKADNLVSSIEEAICEDPQKFLKFLRVLEQAQALYHEAILELKKSLSMRATLAGRKRPSSLSLKEQSGCSLVYHHAMRRGSVSMVMTTPRKPIIPSSSAIVCPTVQPTSFERMQIYQRMRRLESSAACFPQNQQHFAEPTNKARHRSSVIVTDVAGNNQELTVFQQGKSGYRTETLLPEQAVQGLNNTDSSPCTPPMTKEDSDHSQAYSCSNCPVPQENKRKTKTMRVVKYSPTGNSFPKYPKPFVKLKDVVDSPTSAKESSGTSQTSLTEADLENTPVQSRAMDILRLSSVDSSSDEESQKSVLEKCGRSIRELDMLHRELEDVRQKQKKKKKLVKLRERLLRTSLAEKERKIEIFKEKSKRPEVKYMR